MSVYEDPKEHELEELYGAGVIAHPHIPELADRWLEELCDEGCLPDPTLRLIRVGGLPAPRSIAENPANRSPSPYIEHAVLANGQTLWLRRSREPQSKGYRGVGVVDRPERSTQAVLAALAILEARKVDPAGLSESALFADPDDAAGIAEDLYERFEDSRRKGQLHLPRDPSSPERTLQYVYELLRYYRPDFDSLPVEQRRELMRGCCDRINQILDSARRFAEFLEYGAPNKDQRPAVENASRDVEAAILKEVEHLKHREIAEALDVEISENSRVVGDYSTVSKMVRRGRDILERAYGHDGWDEMAEDMRRELAGRGVPPA